MDLRPLEPKYKSQYNKLVTHVMQSWEWGDFREALGTKVLRFGIFKNGKLVKAFQLTLHKIPFTSQYLGYMPKGPLPDKELAGALEKIGTDYNCAFIKLEPDVLASTPLYSVYHKFLPSPKPMFSKYNFLLDLTPSEEELMKKMNQKTRYNVRLAEKKGVTVENRTDDKALEMYLKLYFETTERQGFHGHNRAYHKTVFKTLKEAGMVNLLIAFYRKKPLTAWMLFNFKDKLYYAYGGSSTEYKEVMSNNLVAWEAIKLGKSLNLKEFDMWGAAHSPNPTPQDPYYGFHRFKQGYGGELVEYIGTYDLVFNDTLYWGVTIIDRFTSLKVFLLKILGK